MPYAPIHGQSIHYTDTGGSGPALLFSHGLLMDGAMFEAQVEALRDRYRCITWDERGHGLTVTTPGPFTHEDSADDAVALLAHLGLSEAVFLGMSQGGFLSLRAALRHPRAVRALVMLDSQAGAEDAEQLPVYTAMVQAWASQGLSPATAATLVNLIGGPTFDAAPWVAKWQAIAPATLLQIFNTLATRQDITDQLGNIHQPTLVVHGDSDASIPLAKAQVVVRGIADSRLVVVPGGGHASNMTHAAEVNRALNDFLSQTLGDRV